MNLSTLVYATANIIAALTAGILTAVAWRHRHTPNGRNVLYILAVAAGQLTAYNMMLFSRNSYAAHLWYRLFMSLLAFMPPLWLLFVTRYAGLTRRVPRWIEPVLFIMPLLTAIIIWTGNLRHLFWSYIYYRQYALLTIPDTATITYGVWFSIFNGYNYTLLLLAGLILVYAMLNAPHLYRRQTLALFLASLVTFLLSIPDTYKLAEWQYLPLGLALGGIILAWGVFRYQFVNLILAARSVLDENLTDAILVLDHHGTLIDLNPAARQMLDAPPEQLIGQPAPDVLPFWAQIQPHLAEPGPTRTEFSLKTGEENRFYEARLFPFRQPIEHLTGWVVQLRDITLEKEQQEELENYARRMTSVAEEIVHLLDEERRQRQIAESLRQVAIIINSSLDLQTVLAKILGQLRQVIQHNGAAILLKEKNDLVLVAGDMIPQSFIGQRISLDTDAPTARAFKERQLLILDDVRQDPHWEIWPDETPIRGWMAAPLFAEDTPIGIISADSFQVGGFGEQDGHILQTFADHAAIAIRNARQAEQTEQSLKEARLLYRIGDILAKTPDPQQAVQLALGEFLRGIGLEQGGITLFYKEEGYSKLYALYRNGKPQPPGDRLIVSTAHQYLINTRQPLVVYDAYNHPLLLDNRALTLEHSIKSIMMVPLITQGEVIGLLGADTTREHRHFTEREVRLAQAVADQIATAVQNARLFEREQQARAAAEAASHAKSIFLASMSHELRTPLNAIIGFSELLAQEARLTPDQQEMLSTIHENGQHLLHLINDILDISRLEMGQITLLEQDFDLLRLLDGLETMYRLKAEEKGLSLIVDVHPDTPRYVHTDPKRLRQVLINLLDNALKFTPNGHVALRVSPGRPARLEQTGPPAPILPLHFEVEDTGVGIPEDEIESIFEPFVQARQSDSIIGGAGLGLPISRQIVQMMGGQISVTSRVGRGTRFQFDILVRLPHAVVDRSSSKPSVSVPANLSAADLPQDWLDQIQQALNLADIEQIHRLIRQIAAAYPDLAAALTELADNFDYRGMETLLEEVARPAEER
ncbi:MAG: GAF domain-containing protein [Chloroflexi bacterium]|nr:MAG: GAF domain-containing protein [Chloroflexota bacterium]